ncbi:MAG: hypothetical protein GY715_14785 [Planctomycetes bacterium]|nr:hypothetical protein [Planctomycetota bacterium]
MPTGYVISDLHLFAQRSVGGRRLDEIRRAAATAEFFVLNGDIFDFRWSTLPTDDASLDAAIGWLDRLVGDRPDCSFLYTLGNHDCYEPFVTRLETLAAAHRNLRWHPSHVRIGPALFLHGDLPLGRRRPGPPARQLHGGHGRNGRTLRLAYRAFVAARGPRVVASVHRPRRCAKQITRWLHAHGDELADGVTDVYFGHTHRPFADFCYEGRRFHNTGSSIRGLASRMLEVNA